jgi:D-alanyl-D-alanine carboxypeptidase
MRTILARKNGRTTTPPRIRAGIAAVAAAAIAATAAVAWTTGAVRADPGHQGTDQRRLQQDVDAIHAAGATSVLAQVQTPHSTRAARVGVADVKTGEPVPWDSYYRIGSTTKTFTATVALQLVAAGELKLSDTVEHWLPGLVRGNGNDGRRISVENLLRQTSGLNDYDEELPWTLEFTPERFRQERFHAFQPEELLSLATKRAPQWLPDAADPGAETRWAYSNTNYVLADMIIEKVTGHPLAQEINDRIIAPLGLHHTIMAGTSAYVPRPSANGYTQFPGQRDLVDTSLFVPLPDAPMTSTTADVNTFLRALLSGRLLPAPQLAEMKRTVPAEDLGDGPGSRYGLGISWRPVDGCRDGIWSHGGTMPGYISEAAVTGDGTRAVAISTTTWRPGDEQQDRQETAMTALVDHALCSAR